LHLECLSCLPALEFLFGEVGDNIGLVVTSRRFGAPRKGLWRQAWQSLKRSGMRFTIVLGCDLFLPRLARGLAVLTRLLGLDTSMHAVRALAKRHGARYLETSDINGMAAMSELSTYRPDIVVCLHFDQILGRSFIDSIGVPIVNVHPSLLPGYRGPCPSFWVLDAGERTAGVTIHRIADETIDTGERLAWLEIAVPRVTSMIELDTELFRFGAVQLVALLREQGTLHSRDATKMSNDYFSFPSAITVRRAGKNGVRLWRLGPAIGLLAAAIGIRPSFQPGSTVLACSPTSGGNGQSVSSTLGAGKGKFA